MGNGSCITKRDYRYDAHIEDEECFESWNFQGIDIFSAFFTNDFPDSEVAHGQPRELMVT